MTTGWATRRPNKGSASSRGYGEQWRHLRLARLSPVRTPRIPPDPGLPPCAPNGTSVRMWHVAQSTLASETGG